RGLIRYASLEGITKQEKGLLSVRVLAYSAVLVGLLGVLGYLLTTRSAFELTLMRTPGLTYQRQPNGQVSNLYSLQLVNKSTAAATVTLKIKDNAGVIRLIGNASVVAASEVANLSFFIDKTPAQLRSGNQTVEVEIWMNNALSETLSTSFLAP
ncbi:MAG: cytochrome c oxidase accessory protein CcoG, partial [Runella slithyformis]